MFAKLFQFFLKRKEKMSILYLILIVIFLYCTWPGPDRVVWNNPFDPTNPNKPQPPMIVNITKDTAIGLNDSLWVKVSAVSENSNVTAYLWSIGDDHSIDTTTDGKHLFVWSKNDTGQKVISVWAINEYDMLSNQAIIRVIVKSSKPVISKLNDTIVSEGARVEREFSAIDKDGKIVKYYWSTKDSGWEDSAVVNNTTYKASFSKGKEWIMSIRWAAVDDDYLFTEDTFKIIFNHSPDSVWLAGNDTLSFVSYSHQNNSGIVKCVFAAIDQDSIDTITYFLIVKNLQQDTILSYTGRDTFTLLPDMTPATKYEWKIVAKDLFGDSAASHGWFWTATIPASPIGMKLITAQDKYFKMGQSGFDTSETPIHTVGFSYSFWIDTIEVTNGQYAEVMGLPVPETSFINLPVTNISWYDAVLYCNTKSKKEKRDTVYVYTSKEDNNKDVFLTNLKINYTANGYRLPTEAEWEYACRKDSLTLFFWGNSSTEAVLYVWTKENSGGEVHAGAMKKPNAFGLYDMSGNVWEWCNDWFDPFYYTKAPFLDPVGPSEGVEKVIRGGSFSTSLYFSQCGTRSKISPLTKANNIGFRTILVEK